MKKKVYKIAAAIMALILMCCLCCFIVSAEGETTSNLTHIYVRDQVYKNAFVWDFGSNGTDAFSYLDYRNFTTLTADNSSKVSTMLGTYDYEYQQYNLKIAPTNKMNCVMSFAIVDYPITAVNESSSVFNLTSGVIDFWTSSNISVVGIRFSLRWYDETASSLAGKIGMTVAASQVYPIYGSPGSSTMEYGFMVDHYGTIRLKWLNNVFSTVTPLKTVLCVDFLFHQIYADNGFHSLGISTDTYFDAYEYYAYGPSEPGYDSILDNPIYKIPDRHVMDQALKLQSSALGEFSDGMGSLSSLVKSLRDGLPDFAVGLDNIAAILEYGVSSLPFFSFIITVGLILGLTSFVMGLAGSLHSPKEKSSSSREEQKSDSLIKNSSKK